MVSYSSALSGLVKVPWPSNRSCLQTRNTGMTSHWSSTTHGEAGVNASIIRKPHIHIV